MCLLQEADKYGYMAEYVHILANDTEYVTTKTEENRYEDVGKCHGQLGNPTWPPYISSSG